MKYSNSLMIATASIAGCLAASASYAQPETQTNNNLPKGRAGALLEEVQVIARKRSAAEDVQDIPIAITAFGASQLDALYMQDLKDLSFSMPSVQTDEVGTFPGVQNFTIRGQGINSSIPSVDPTVGVFIDGMYLGVTYGVVMDMFDLERVEVSRGPQGLLFGRNVTGGAINIRTARPNGEFGFKARTRVSTGLETNVAGSIEGGLSKSVAAKLTLYYNDDEGYWDNKTNTNNTDPVWATQNITSVPEGGRENPAKGGSTGASTHQFACTAIVWDASQDLDITFLGETGELDGDGAVWATREPSPLFGELDSDETAQDENGVADMEWNQAIVEANWRIGPGVLTNILGYRDITLTARTDIDGVSAPLFNVGADTEQDQISNELRYAFTTSDGLWNVTTGLYYFQQDIEYREQRWAGIGLIAGVPLPVLNTINLGGDMEHETWGVFASTDYALSAGVSITAGLRYTYEEKDAAVVNADPNAGGVPCTDPSFASCGFDQLSDDWSNLTPQLGVNWMVNDDTKLYAMYTKGFRSGGVNFRNALPSIIDPGPTKEEEQDAFEIGFKSTLADNRLRINGAIYHVQVSDMQRELNVGSSEIPLVGSSGVLVWQATVNAGDVDITGAELEVAALLTDSFSINGALGYVESEYKSRSDQIIAAEAITGTTLVGDDLPRLAPFTGSVGFTYDVDLNDIGLITLRGNYSYRDEAPYNDSNTQVFKNKTMTNASIQWTSPEAHWTASLFGKNLNDEVQWGSLNALIGTSGGVSKGRVYGAEVTYRY